MFTKRIIKVFLIAIVAFAFASVATAYAAANTVPDTFAGDGAGDVSGYLITNVHYVLGSDPGNIDSVEFTTDWAVPTGSTVTITLDDTNWHSACTGLGTTSISCDTNGATVLDATTLRVVIAN